GNTEVFYRELRSSAVGRVVIFPLLQSPGTAGLVLYAMQLSPAVDELFEREVAEFLDHAKGTYRTEALRMKPLNNSAIEVNLVRGNLQPNKNGPVVYKEGQNIHETLEIR